MFRRAILSALASASAFVSLSFAETQTFTDTVRVVMGSRDVGASAGYMFS